MANKSTATTTGRPGAFGKFIDWIERVGNKLPHPFFLFTALAVIVLVLSLVFQGISATYVAGSQTAEAKEVTVTVTNLLTVKYFQNIIQKIVTIYINFSPLGTVLFMMLAIGYVQETGFFNAFMKKTLLGAPTFIITFVLAVVGVNANIASNGGIIFATSLGAMLFASIGRNPILGAITGYVAGHGGFSASMLVAATDVNLSAITQSAIDSVGLDYTVHPMCNYYWMFFATIVIGLVITVITEKIMPKYLTVGNNLVKAEVTEQVTEDEKKGLRYALIAFVVFVVVLLAMVIPKSGWLRADDGTLLPKSPFISGIVGILFILFFVVATAYGIGAKVIKKQGDIPKFMGAGVRDSISFLVISLPASLFIQFFSDSKLATVIAVKGSEVLKATGISGIALMVGFLFLTCFCNLFMTSGASKYLILAPIFVPLFAYMGLSPNLTQGIYRIGDSITNPIAPINYFLPVVLGIINKYLPEDEEFGIGSLMSLTIPYSIGFLIVMVPLAIIWMLLGLDMGPASPIFM